MSRLTSLACLLRELRESRGISARRIEQLGGPSRKILREYESGERVPTEHTVQRLLAVMAIPETDPEYKKIIKLARVARTKGMDGMDPSLHEAFVDEISRLVLRLDGRPVTELLELNARNEALAVMRRVIGDRDGDSDT